MKSILEGLGWEGPPLPASHRILPEKVLPSGETSNSFASWLEGQDWRPRSSIRRATLGIDLLPRALGRLFNEPLIEWWIENAWLSPFSSRSAADLLELLDVPVPIDSWDAFDSLFAWDERFNSDRTIRADTMLGVAVHRFFLQGGRKCYVIRAGDPWQLFAKPNRANFRARVLRDVPAPTPADRSTWHGVGHLFGLRDVSFLCIPDLPELFAVDTGPVVPEGEELGKERFIECGTRVNPPAFRSLRALPAPRCDESGFRDWAVFIKRISNNLVERYCREVQFVAALPLPLDEVSLRSNADVAGLRPGFRRSAVADRIFTSRAAQWESAASIQTAFVQLVYPWLTSPESQRLSGALEAPDAMLTGLLANTALTRGAWRSAARETMLGAMGLEPILSRAELEAPLLFQDAAGQLRLTRTVRERISVFGQTPAGLQLLSDVTTDDDEAYRPANVNRLVSSIVRGARLLGEDAVFANNGEAVWRTVQSALEELLLGLWGAGAFAGARSAEAFEVRCDRSTMTQADIDAGRVIARVQFTAASPIDRITVVFAMDEGGELTLVPSQPQVAAEVSA
ncbi:MAG TPA: hypothetical protein VE422_45755 [Terriglobia bacterium]|nr:hypothetical protein [Terriglobia bacterium]